MILDERDKHPPLSGEMVVGVIIHPLSTDRQVLPARKVVLPLIVAHPYLVPSLEEIVVWLVDEDIPQLQLLIKLHLQSVLLEYGVVVVDMVGVVFGIAGLATIWSISLQHRQSRLVNEIEDDVMDIVIPEATLGHSKEFQKIATHHLEAKQAFPVTCPSLEIQSWSGPNPPLARSMRS